MLFTSAPGQHVARTGGRHWRLGPAPNKSAKHALITAGRPLTAGQRMTNPLAAFLASEVLNCWAGPPIIYRGRGPGRLESARHLTLPSSRGNVSKEEWAYGTDVRTELKYPNGA